MIAQIYAGSCEGCTLSNLDFYRQEDIAEGEEPHSHVTSISVLHSYRRLGLAKKVTIQSHEFIILDQYI